jgi:hypothetical protein
VGQSLKETEEWFNVNTKTANSCCWIWTSKSTVFSPSGFALEFFSKFEYPLENVCARPCPTVLEPWVVKIFPGVLHLFVTSSSPFHSYSLSRVSMVVLSLSIQCPSVKPACLFLTRIQLICSHRPDRSITAFHHVSVVASNTGRGRGAARSYSPALITSWSNGADGCVCLGSGQTLLICALCLW